MATAHLAARIRAKDNAIYFQSSRGAGAIGGRASKVHTGFTSFHNEHYISFGTPASKDACGHSIGWHKCVNQRDQDRVRDIVELRAKLIGAGIPKPEMLRPGDSWRDEDETRLYRSKDKTCGKLSEAEMRKRLVIVLNAKYFSTPQAHAKNGNDDRKGFDGARFVSGA